MMGGRTSDRLIRDHNKDKGNLAKQRQLFSYFSPSSLLQLRRVFASKPVHHAHKLGHPTWGLTVSETHDDREFAASAQLQARFEFSLSPEGSGHGIWPLSCAEANGMDSITLCWSDSAGLSMKLARVTACASSQLRSKPAIWRASWRCGRPIPKISFFFWQKAFYPRDCNLLFRFSQRRRNSRRVYALHCCKSGDYINSSTQGYDTSESQQWYLPVEIEGSSVLSTVPLNVNGYVLRSPSLQEHCHRIRALVVENPPRWPQTCDLFLDSVWR
ncbi:hypothetical protein DFH06DRAFT_1148691 [Mycena polygramma]|nr:hypothetical protein DFH06DRAFT_1148691 [Mycena polygramma]